MRGITCRRGRGEDRDDLTHVMWSPDQLLMHCLCVCFVCLCVYRYDSKLGEALKVGTKKGVTVGLNFGFIFFLFFALDGVAFWQVASHTTCCVTDVGIAFSSIGLEDTSFKK